MGLSNILNYIDSELKRIIKYHEKSNLKVRKRKLPKHAESLMCVGDFRAGTVALEISKLTKENNLISIDIVKVIKGTHVYSRCICQPMDSDYCIYNLQCVYFIDVTIRDECLNIIYYFQSLMYYLYFTARFTALY